MDTENSAAPLAKTPNEIMNLIRSNQEEKKRANHAARVAELKARLWGWRQVFKGIEMTVNEDKAMYCIGGLYFSGGAGWNSLYNALMNMHVKDNDDLLSLFEANERPKNIGAFRGSRLMKLLFGK